MKAWWMEKVHRGIASDSSCVPLKHRYLSRLITTGRQHNFYFCIMPYCCRAAFGAREEKLLLPFLSSSGQEIYSFLLMVPQGVPASV
ncbi:hypothetical protein E2C01_050643 [Portunus trituberculatus]|uniref:Uncharacterized protein n=1 Tax=Portunus trituberculatus TaxID=210409 RepID=A0A5B7GI31_PORTR|nr:hypothetical protein [Portunus trituberculatus]